MIAPPIVQGDDLRQAIEILVVEDEWMIAEELKDRLETMGFKVKSMCASSEEAIALCEQHQPNLVLMDICLRTEMDGIEAASIIRKRFDTPVVYVTAFAHSDLVARALATRPMATSSSHSTPERSRS